MPFIDVTLGSGRSPEQVRALIHELTEAAHRAVGAPREAIRVVIREVQPEHWAAGDVTTAERQAAARESQS
ncbi:MAG: 4-oxalocrotonate tautomerase family protein [Actinomycetota bacterium]|nr:4-oxalocrotonate tautomerase family protein [Actinomycetota bacterium]